MKLTEKQILSSLKKKINRPMKISELSKHLGITDAQRREFRNKIKEMAAQGTLIKIRGGRYGLPDEMNLVTGKLHGHPNGFGFVIPDKHHDTNDVFVHRKSMNEAMHQDHVVVRIESEKEPGRPEGRVIRILQRNTPNIVGVYETFGRDGWVIPTENKHFHDVFIPGKNRKDAKNGQIVDVKIETYPTRHQPPVGKVMEILGTSNDPEVEVQSILRKFGVRRGFTPKILKEAKAVAKSNQADDRKDLTNLLTFTIDGEKAKDFDDAVSLEPMADGFRLGVHIADVSHFVTENSPLDKEAFQRGTSVYYADGVIPMLPEILSNDACSLKPEEIRLTLSVFIDFDRQGNVLHKQIHKSFIKSQRRFTYTEVAKLLAEGSNKEKDVPFMQTLADMHHLSQVLRRRRFKNGSVDFHVPEPDIQIEDGKVNNIGIAVHNEAHQLIEEFMLAANQAVALSLHEKEIPCIHRIHEPPEPSKLFEFKEFISSFGLRLSSPEKIRSKDLNNLLKKIEDTAEERVVNTLLLRTMKKARYSPTDPGHYCLGFPHYVHFTSPIRRYPDLIVHRIVKKYLKNKCSKKEKKALLSSLNDISEQSTQMEIQAMSIEREIISLRQAQFMVDKIGKTFYGHITGVTGFGFFVELENVFVEGLVKLSSIMDDYYLYIETEHKLIGQKRHRVFQIGDRVKVRLKDVDISRRQIDLQVMGEI
ncbi:MAG: ribonuclease R [Nitrospinota bacterium]